MKNSPLLAKREMLLNIFSAMFIIFWLYAAGIKFYDLSDFKQEMHNQVFPRIVSDILWIAVPVTEILIAAMLSFTVTRTAGILLSFILMLLFTAYIGLALLNVYSRIPCNCAGILGPESSWQTHFILNLIVLAIAGAGLIFTFKSKERRKQSMDGLLSHAPSTK